VAMFLLLRRKLSISVREERREGSRAMFLAARPGRAHSVIRLEFTFAG
jgi:hypothetical protein